MEYNGPDNVQKLYAKVHLYWADIGISCKQEKHRKHDRYCYSGICICAHLRIATGSCNSLLCVYKYPYRHKECHKYYHAP